jgi:hypothetical protein
MGVLNYAEGSASENSSKMQGQAGLWLALMVIVPTALVLVLLIHFHIGKHSLRMQNDCLALATMVGGMAGMAWLYGRRSGRNWGATFALTTATSCLLIILAIVWNKLFQLYIARTGYHKDVFRAVFRTLHAPLYGKVHLKFLGARTLLPIGIALAFLWDIWRRRGIGIEGRFLLARVLLFLMAMTLAVALADGQAPHGERITDYWAHYAAFAQDLDHFSGPGDVLRTYVNKTPLLTHFDTHYPPGILFTFMIGKLLGTTTFVKALGILLPALTLLPLWCIARELQLDRRATGLALVLFATSPGIVIFPTLAPTAALTFVSTFSIWMLIRALQRRQWWASALFGLSLAIYTFCTFASHMTVFLIACFLAAAVLSGKVTLRQAAMAIIPGALAFVLFFVVLYIGWRFNIIASFLMARKMHIKRPGHGYDNIWRYLFRSTGGILAYLLSAGFALSVMAIAAMGRRKQVSEKSPLAGAFILGTLLGMLVSGFSGMSFMETERIWIFFAPPLAILGGIELARRREIEGRHAVTGIVLLALTFGCVYELCFQHYLWHPQRPDDVRMEE